MPEATFRTPHRNPTLQRDGAPAAPATTYLLVPGDTEPCKRRWNNM